MWGGERGCLWSGMCRGCTWGVPGVCLGCTEDVPGDAGDVSECVGDGLRRAGDVLGMCLGLR